MKNKIFLVMIAVASLTGPAFAAKNVKSTEATNTGVNARDESNATLTPMDQSLGSDHDVELTRRIRELVVKDDAMSTNAKNVKIVTLQGVTVLRGPVDSEAEKAKVATLAKQVVGKRAVRNELDVQVPTND